MTGSQLTVQRLTAPFGTAALLAVTILLLIGGIAHAQEGGSEITPSFGDGKLKILGAGFKSNENVVITVKIDSSTFTFNATADARGAFQLDTGLNVKPGSSVELDARGDQGSGSAAITSVPNLPLPQTGAALNSLGVAFLAGLLLLAAGASLFFTRNVES